MLNDGMPYKTATAAGIPPAAMMSNVPAAGIFLLKLIIPFFFIRHLSFLFFRNLKALKFPARQ